MTDDAKIAVRHDGAKREFDKVWKTLRILKADLVQLRSTMDIIERKANRIAVTASRERKTDQTESEARPRRAGDRIIR